MKRRRKRRLLRIRALALLTTIALGVCALCACEPVRSIVPSQDRSAVASDEGRFAVLQDGMDISVRRDEYHFLVLGEDRSGKLTDVILLVALNTKRRSAAVIQIPRDTYARYTDRDYKKLNGAYARLGIYDLRAFLEKGLGIRIDRHLILDLDAFSEIVDAVGGVDIDLPADLTYEDPAQGLHIFLEQGHQHLNGDTAEQFVRYRSGYVEADLGRMDAQKLFLAAFVDTVKQKMSLPVAVQLIRSLYGEVETDLTLAECCVLAPVLLSAELSDVVLTTLPGQAVRTSGGTWYYVLSRDPAAETLADLFGGANFDQERSFTDLQRREIQEIYETAVDRRTYRADEIRRNGLPIRQKS